MRLDTENMEKMDGNAIAKACLYFSRNKRGTAKDVDVHGATMCSLCRRGFLKVIGETSEMVQVGDNLYRKYPAKIYAPADECSAEKMWNAYREHMVNSYDFEMRRTRIAIENLKHHLKSLEELRAQFE